MLPLQKGVQTADSVQNWNLSKRFISGAVKRWCEKLPTAETQNSAIRNDQRARRHKNTQNTALASQKMENAPSNYSAHSENTKAIQP